MHLRRWLAQRHGDKRCGRAFGHAATVTLGKDDAGQQQCRPAFCEFRLARSHLEQPERGALRIGEDRETSAGEFHRRDEFGDPTVDALSSFTP